MPARFLDPDSAAAARALLPSTLRFWLDAEQTRITREVDRRLIEPGSVDKIAEGLRPEARRIFVLPSWWVPEQDARTWTARLPGSMRKRFFRRQHVLVLLHPLALPGAAWLCRGLPGPPLVAAATSSIRTVLAWSPNGEGTPFFAKLSVPRVVAGAYRGLTPVDIATSVGKSRVVPASAGLLGFLGEPLGIAPLDDAPLGFLIRAVPDDVLEGRRSLVPFYALTNASSTGEGPLLPARLARVRDDVLQPLLSSLVDAAVRGGLAVEAHAQNLLVELDARHRPSGRFFVRDLEGVSLDVINAPPSLLKRLPVLRNVDDDYDALDHRRAVKQSLHSFFVGGPLHRLSRLVGRELRSEFDDALVRAMRRHEKNAAVARDGEAFCRWVEAQRWRRRRQPPVPHSLRRWLHFEQQVNDRARHPRLFAPIDLGVLPAHLDPRESPVFDLDAILVPIEDVELVPASLPASLRKHLVVETGGRSLVRFHVHPAARDDHAIEIAEYGLERGVHRAAPTSSPRSLVVWSRLRPAEPFGLKLSVDVEIQGISRVLRVSKLRRAVAVTRLLSQAPLMDAGIGFLPEPATLRLRHRNDGSIVRVLPSPMNHLVPGFSLFARGAFKQDADVVVREVLEPLVRAAAFLFFAEGLLPDLHQQNVLFDRGAHPSVVIRDLDSVKTDLDVRIRRGLDVRPFVESPGTLEDLKLADTPRWYDDAFGKQLRAEWVFLAERVLQSPRMDRHLYLAVDRQMLAETARHLGVDVVVEELRYVFAHSGLKRFLAAADDVNTLNELVELLHRLPARAFFDLRRPETTRYSVNAMVHAWRRRVPLPAGGVSASQAAFKALIDAGRATTSSLPRGAAIFRRHGDVLVALDRRGTAVSYALRCRFSG